MATAQDLLLDPALRKVGVRNPQVSDRTEALASLNSMLNSWSAEGLMVFSVTRENFPLVVNDAEYTIGTGGDFNTVRPNQIVCAYLRSGGTDYTLQIDALSDYNKISVKTTNSRPTKLYYLSEYPLGKILLNYEPVSADTLFLDSWKPLLNITLPTDQVILPAEYEEAVIYGLRMRLSSEHNDTISPVDVAIARKSKQIIKSLNSPRMEEADFSHLPISRVRRFDILTES